jgi:hypothetical protein
MIPLLVLLGIAVGPVGVTWAVLRGFRALGGAQDPARRASPATPAPGAPLSELVDTLGRLERDYAALERAQAPYGGTRMLAVAHAYDETLRRCCAVLELPLPAPPPLDGLARLEVEAALASRGLSW